MTRTQPSYAQFKLILTALSLVLAIPLSSAADTEVPQGELAAKAETVAKVTKHPCHGISGAPYKKYVGFQIAERNNQIYRAQGNRNPFIDHPELVNRINNF